MMSSDKISSDGVGKLDRSFEWLNATQFLGALNDNVFKLTAIFFGVHLLGKEHSDAMSNLGTLIFSIPFILFLPFAGVLADRKRKSGIVVFSKVFEIVVMACGMVAFMTWPLEPRAAVAVVMGVLFLLGVQAAIFAPSKYGIIPELVSVQQLSRANGWLQGLTYLGIIIGTGSAGFLIKHLDDRYALMGAIAVGLAVVGTLTATRIRRTDIRNAEAKASVFFFADVWRTMRGLKGDRFLVLAILGSAYFSFIGAFLINTILPYSLKELGLDKDTSGLLMLAAAIGIGAGSVIAGKLSGRNIEFGIVPLGALLVSTASISIGALHTGRIATGFWVFLAGLGSGMFIVPLEAFVQWRAPKDRIGEVIAALNWLGWVGVLLASGIGLGLAALDLHPGVGFFVLGGFTLVLLVATLRILPDFTVRFIAMLITNVLYRIRVLGLENLPTEGPALLVANHVSKMDAVQILAVQQRRIRFLMERKLYDRSPLRPLLKLMGVIPIAGDDPPKKIIESLHAARAALDAGYMVCIFAEGRLTRSGNMFEFRHGFERILKGSNYPIIPIYIGGTWGSLFSHYYEKQQTKIPVRIPYPATLIFGAPMPATTKAPEIRQRVMELSTDYFDDRKRQHRSLAREWIGVARANWNTHAMSDTTGKRLTYGKALVSSFALANVIARVTKDQKSVGVLLPTTCVGSLVNLALALLHKTGINLNYTASQDALDYAIKQGELKTIITSAAFLEKMPAYANLPGLIKIEDLSAQITGGVKLCALLRARFVPLSLVASDAQCNGDDVATVIFSSGTTGEPKGVMLTQHNILSNVEALRMVFRPRLGFDLAAALPLFHSFGYTAGIWFPLLSGMSVSYHTSPLDFARIAQMVRENKSQALFATPTFLLGYLRKAKREDFATLKFVITGAEKLKPRVAEAFHERFGITPLEGYGTTELSPVATLSLPHAAADGVEQTGSKPGSVGQPIPGVSIRIVDPDTNAILPVGQPGLLLIKGPNVMLGYLNKPQLTADVIRDGWYRTGDIAKVDDEGFVTITDRLSRFSKIAGEMVPHGAIEDELQRALGTSEHVVAITSVPDEKRGEKLILLYTEAAGSPEELRAILDASNLPNLWKPAKDAYFKIEAVPVTGTGKVEFKTLKTLALAALETSGTGASSPDKSEP